MTNGAQALVRTLIDAGVTACFTNPGTSEMHFVAALDSAPEMRAVLTLFEGVATGAADGYARMADRPAATLLHLGPGLGNGLANLHNARRAQSPVVNIVGDHATYHKQYDAQLDVVTQRPLLSERSFLLGRTLGECRSPSLEPDCERRRDGHDDTEFGHALEERVVLSDAFSKGLRHDDD